MNGTSGLEKRTLKIIRVKAAVLGVVPRGAFYAHVFIKFISVSQEINIYLFFFAEYEIKYPMKLVPE